jgi:hypothetical protein
VNHVRERRNRGTGAVVHEREMMRCFQDGSAARTIRHVVFIITNIIDDFVDEIAFFRGA